MFRRARAELDRRRRQAILRGVYEENLRLREPGYCSPKPARANRQTLRVVAVASVLFIVAASLLYQLTLGAPTEASATGYAAIQAVPAEGPKALGARVPDAGTAGWALSDGSVHGEREATAEAGGAGPSVRELFGLSVRTITIDAGHGGRDPGAIGKSGLREKDVTLDIARRLRDKLARNLQFRIHMVRNSDIFVPLNERADYANARATDLFVSVHVNYLAGTSTNAVETYYFGQYQDLRTRRLAQRENEHSSYTIGEFEALVREMQDSMKLEESKALAKSIQASLLRNMRQHNRTVLDTGVRAAPFAVLLGVKAPSVLVEIGSLSSAEAERSLGEIPYRDEIATYLAAGITEYLDTQTQEVDAHHVKGKDGIAGR
jgi:N-acetylmuramoyl-L-alanine amidase